MVYIVYKVFKEYTKQKIHYCSGAALCVGYLFIPVMSSQDK